MNVSNSRGYPVLILGAGRGGSALLEMFLSDELVNVVGIADANSNAAGILLAKQHNIPTYADSLSAIIASKAYDDCIIYNLTHDDKVSHEVSKVLGDKKVTSGLEAKLFWQMVTNLKHTKDELLKIQEELKAVIQHAMDGIISINSSGEIQGFNPAAEKIFGHARDAVLGKNISALIPEFNEISESQPLQDKEHLEHRWRAGGRSREVNAIRSNGEVFPMELSASEMMLHGQQYYMGIVRDITERKLAEQKIVHLAHHDQLTGMPNRVVYFERLKQAIQLAQRNQQKLAVMFLDLDGFKVINDTLGHDAGDLLLKEVAQRLQQLIRASDTVARVGGDEFTFVLNNIETNSNAAITAKKIIGQLSTPFNLQGKACQIGGSIGISFFPNDSEDFGQLLKYADEAMYRAKQRGKNTYQLYSDMNLSSSV